MLGRAEGEIGCRGHVLLGGHGIAHRRRIILIDPHHPEGQQLAIALDLYLAAQGGAEVAMKHVVHQLVADNAHIPAAINILLLYPPSGQQLQIVHRAILHIDAAEADVGVQPPVLGLPAARGFPNGDPAQILPVPLPQGAEHILCDQVVLLRADHAHHTHHAAGLVVLLPERNGNIAGSQPAHGAGNRAGQAVAHGQDADDRADADDNAQHGQQRTHFIGPQALQRQPDALTEPHSAPPPRCRPHTAARPAW